MTNTQHIRTAVVTPPPALFRSPEPSRADRMPSLRSRGSHRGGFVGGSVPTRIVYESGLEHNWAVVLLATTGVSGLREQVRVPYRDERGRAAKHVFDLLVTLDDGRRLLMPVKPSQRARRTGLAGLMRLIAPQVPVGLADGIVILTERRLTEVMLRDATLVHSVRRDGAGPDDDAVMGVMTATVGAVTVRDLMGEVGRGGQGFRAVVRRIADGDLVLASPPPITHASLVALPGGAVNHRLGFPDLVTAATAPSGGGTSSLAHRGV